MKHSSSYDNLIPEEEPDVDEDMYTHLKEDQEFKKGKVEDDELKTRKVAPDIGRRISLLENEGLVDDVSPTKKDIAVTYIDDIDEDKEMDIKKKAVDDGDGEKKDITVTYIDTEEPDDKPRNELKDKWKSAKRQSSIDNEDDKTGLFQKLNAGPVTPVKPIDDEDGKEDLSYIDEAETDNKPKKVQQNNQPLEGNKFKVETDIQRRIRELRGKKTE